MIGPLFPGKAPVHKHPASGMEPVIDGRTVEGIPRKKVEARTPQKERLTKDVRYQEYREVTPDGRRNETPLGGHFFFVQMTAGAGDGSFLFARTMLKY